MNDSQSKELLVILGGIAGHLADISYELGQISKQLNADNPASAASHLVDSIGQIPTADFDVSGVEASLDKIIAPVLQEIAGGLDS